MKRLLAILALCAGLCVPASAQLTMTGVGSAGSSGGGGGGGGTLTLTAVANPTPVTGNGVTSPISFASTAIGTASSDRIVVVSVFVAGAAGSANAIPSAVSIGGTAATQASRNDNGQYSSTIWYALITTGTTATINVTITGGTGWSNGASIAVYTLTGSATASVASTLNPGSYYAVTSASGSITVPTGGVAIALGIGDNASLPTFTWTGATRDYQNAANYNGSAFISDFAHTTTSGTVQYSSTAVVGLTVAVFQP